jgi:hypothetical protein
MAACSSCSGPERGASIFESFCYGLRVSSDRPVPGLPARKGDGTADLRIYLGQPPDWPADAARLAFEEEAGDGLRRYELPGGRVLLRYADGTVFHVDLTTSEVWGTWPDTGTLEDAATYLLGPVLGFIVRRRGGLCLHASTALIGGRAVAFAGAAGAGKSTLAAALALTGSPILSEDVTCLVERERGFDVEPGYPRIRLWQEAAPLLGATVDALPLLTPTWDKRYLPLNGGNAAFHARRAPLAAVYVLAGRRAMAEPAAVRELGGQEVLSALLANTYASQLLGLAQHARDFAVLGRLARAVPVREIAINENGGRLLEACAWIRRRALA